MISRAYSSFYRSAPLHTEDGIPVFSERDAYIANYERIAADHIASMRPGAENPFIETDLWRQLEESTREFVRTYVSPGLRVLDVGVGLGRVLGPFDNLERYGIDISIEYLKVARATGFDVAFCRIEDIPYRDEVFDAVVACDVLEHVLDLHGCSQEMLRVLRPGGLLIVRVPYLDDLDAYLNPELPYEFIHLRSFDAASLRLHFEKIFGCEYITHETVAPYLKGAPRMKLRPLRVGNLARQLAAEVPEEGHPLSVLRKATLVSEEELIKWIYALRDEHPVLFSLVAEHLVYGLEINIVFKKGGQ